MRKISLFLVTAVCLVLFSLTSCGGEGGQDASNNSDSVTTNQSDAGKTVVGMDLTAGKKVFTEKCQVCHQESGLGVPGTFPPLASSDYMAADKMRAVKQAIYGSKSPITVNGVQYPGKIMTVFEKDLNDQQVMDVVNFVLNSWGNSVGTVNLDDVKKAREAK